MNGLIIMYGNDMRFETRFFPGLRKWSESQDSRGQRCVPEADLFSIGMIKKCLPATHHRVLKYEIYYPLFKFG